RLSAHTARTRKTFTRKTFTRKTFTHRLHPRTQQRPKDCSPCGQRQRSPVRTAPLLALAVTASWTATTTPAGSACDRSKRQWLRPRQAKKPPAEAVGVVTVGPWEPRSTAV